MHALYVTHFNLAGAVAVCWTMAVLLVIQQVIALYALGWPYILSKRSTWGLLMAKYSVSLDKIDVARGRCVPVPKSAQTTPAPSFLRYDLLNMTHSVLIKV